MQCHLGHQGSRCRSSAVAALLLLLMMSCLQHFGNCRFHTAEQRLQQLLEAVVWVADTADAGFAISYIIKAHMALRTSHSSCEYGDRTASSSSDTLVSYITGRPLRSLLLLLMLFFSCTSLGVTPAVLTGLLPAFTAAASAAAASAFETELCALTICICCCADLRVICI